MKSKEKLNNGITLVALVITIIILLILAGISISALTNQGLFGRANDAKRESEIANIKEQIALDIYEKQLEPPLGSITDEQLETILGKYGRVNKEDGTIVGITTEKGYEILLKDIYGGETVAETVPDGAIVTPVNDITTWLKTGEISNQYSYTTIEQVIADSTCTQNLMKSENAMKYLARSTEFADAICASETTMTYLGQSTYVDDTVLNSDYWSSAICNSIYFESVLNVKIPTMTSYTEPTGKVTCSTYYSDQTYGSFYGYYAFSNDGYGWLPSSNDTFNNAFVSYEFESPVSVKKIKVCGTSTGSSDETSNFTLEASVDGISYETIKEDIICKPYSTSWFDYKIPSNVSKYKIYKMKFTNKGTTVKPINATGYKFQLYGR